MKTLSALLLVLAVSTTPALAGPGALTAQGCHKHHGKKVCHPRSEWVKFATKNRYFIPYGNTRGL